MIRLIFLLLAFGLLAGGCVRVHAAMAVSTDDQVSGDLVVASLPSAGNSRGPQLAIPTSLSDRPTATPAANCPSRI
jgi:phosphatidylinositol mannoside-binding LppM-like protein